MGIKITLDSIIEDEFPRFTDRLESLKEMNRIRKERPEMMTDVEMLNRMKSTMEEIRKLTQGIDRDCNYLLRNQEGLTETQFDLFKKAVRTTTFKSFAMLPDPYPETEEAYKNFKEPPELLKAVKGVQDHMIQAVEESYEDLIDYPYYEATNKVYQSIEEDLSECAGVYAITDTACREAVCSYLDTFFKRICVG